MENKTEYSPDIISKVLQKLSTLSTEDHQKISTLVADELNVLFEQTEFFPDQLIINANPTGFAIDIETICLSESLTKDIFKTMSEEDKLKLPSIKYSMVLNTEKDLSENDSPFSLFINPDKELDLSEDIIDIYLENYKKLTVKIILIVIREVNNF